MIKNILLIIMSINFFVYAQQIKKKEMDTKSIHDFKMKSIEGKEIDLSIYKGKTVLIVNVASKCGLTPQYVELQELYNKYSSKGLVILGFPANNFGAQEPGSNNEIQEFCTKNYGVTFQMFSKISVKGSDIDLFILI